MTFTICDFCQRPIGLFEMRYTFKLKDNREIEQFSGVFCEDCKERVRMNRAMSESFLEEIENNNSIKKACDTVCTECGRCKGENKGEVMVEEEFQ